MVDNPVYREEADKIIAAANEVKDAAVEHGVKSTAFTMALLAVLMKMTGVAGKFLALPASERDDFFGEVWDAGIGNEPNALVQQAWFLSGDALEKVSDGLKAGALSYFNRNVPLLPPPAE